MRSLNELRNVTIVLISNSLTKTKIRKLYLFKSYTEIQVFDEKNNKNCVVANSVLSAANFAISYFSNH